MFQILLLEVLDGSNCTRVTRYTARKKQGMLFTVIKKKIDDSLDFLQSECIEGHSFDVSMNTGCYTIHFYGFHYVFSRFAPTT